MLHVYKQVVADFPFSENSKFMIEQLRKASADYWKARRVVPVEPAETAVQALSLINKVFAFHAKHGFKTTVRKVSAVILRRLFRR